MGSSFEFGKNWRNYLLTLNDEKIIIAQKSLTDFLGRKSLVGKKFLDAGSGSGLFSLTARKLGAEVVSFDIDKESVQCAKIVKNRYYPDDENWLIKKGSLLDANFIKNLGRYDIVYCWGVAHHTGNLKKALANLVPTVNKNGLLYLGIYNDQGAASLRWKKIKRRYNQLPAWAKPIYLIRQVVMLEIITVIKYIFRLKVKEYINVWKSCYRNPGRGMNRWHDYVDWVGGYPFEVAKPEYIFNIFQSAGFELIKIKTVGGGLANNEYLFRKK